MRLGSQKCIPREQQLWSVHFPAWSVTQMCFLLDHRRTHMECHCLQLPVCLNRAAGLCSSTFKTCSMHNSSCKLDLNDDQSLKWRKSRNVFNCRSTVSTGRHRVISASHKDGSQKIKKPRTSGINAFIER